MGSESLPYFARGEVVKGFGRGSKQLGIPTGITTVRALRPTVWLAVQRDLYCTNYNFLTSCGQIFGRHSAKAGK